MKASIIILAQFILIFEAMSGISFRTTDQMSCDEGMHLIEYKGEEKQDIKVHSLNKAVTRNLDAKVMKSIADVCEEGVAIAEVIKNESSPKNMNFSCIPQDCIFLKKDKELLPIKEYKKDDHWVAIFHVAHHISSKVKASKTSPLAEELKQTNGLPVASSKVDIEEEYEIVIQKSCPEKKDATIKRVDVRIIKNGEFVCSIEESSSEHCSNITICGFNELTRKAKKVLRFENEKSPSSVTDK